MFINSYIFDNFCWHSSGKHIFSLFSRNCNLLRSLEYISICSASFIERFGKIQTLDCWLSDRGKGTNEERKRKGHVSNTVPTTQIIIDNNFTAIITKCALIIREEMGKCLSYKKSSLCSGIWKRQQAWVIRVVMLVADCYLPLSNVVYYGCDGYRDLRGKISLL